MKTCSFMLGGLLLSLALGLYITGYRLNLTHSYPSAFISFPKQTNISKGI